jgi:RNA polymerase sigma factor (sigma-70 family)
VTSRESRPRTAEILALPEPADSLSGLYLRYRRDIVDFIRRKFGPGPPEPEDVAQAVFLQLAAQGERERIEDPRSFLLKAAQNVVLDHYRRSQRQPAPASGHELESRENLSEIDPERVVTAEERLRVLMCVLERLPARKRQMVLLSRIHGLSCQEIGRRLGVSAEAVQKQIERVLKDCLVALEHGSLEQFRRKGSPQSRE